MTKGGGNDGLSTETTLAVLVIFGRKPHEAASWSWLMKELREPVQHRTAFTLQHVLVYDNSPHHVECEADPAGKVTLISNPANGGTTAAYTKATCLAETLGCKWVLFLDQDTAIPEGYLARAAQAAVGSDQPGILAPLVWHHDVLISPAKLTRSGRIVPSRNAATTSTLTAVSSGLFIRNADLARILPFPHELWLDYVDHWMLRLLALAGTKAATIDASLAHDLSIFSPATLSPQRLASIMAAETFFYRGMSPLARSMLFFQRIRRALFYLQANPPLAFQILRRTMQDTFRLR
jgi:hypothetical protein